MTQSYFLGANSGEGFVSLYEDFPPAAGAFLHIIKGGPGTGKSGFMRAIGAAAEERGMEVHYVLCSGDPDSLDGVYLPALGLAWVDGTAPHVIEPRQFHVDSDYVNLGRFCRVPFSEEDAQDLREINHKHKSLYRQAYALLGAAAALESEPKEANPVISQELSALIRDAMGSMDHGTGHCSRRFLHAISCRGELWLTEELDKLCKHIIRLDSAVLLDQAAREALRLGAGVILCPSPLCPDRAECVVLPGLQLAFVGRPWPGRVTMNLDASGPPDAQAAEAALLQSRLIELAVSHLRAAKLLHDEMEAVYKRSMDFPALTGYTQEQIKQIFA